MQPSRSRARNARPTSLPRFGVAALALLLAWISVGATLAAPGVTPQTVDLTLGQGESATVDKAVETSFVPPKLDVYFLADTTGSMGPAIANVQANAGSILGTIGGASADSAFGAGDYKDFFGGPYAFNNCAAIGGNAAGCIGGWGAGGGNDGSEGQFFALQQLAGGAAGFRAGATKVIVWFGDAPAHDPVCAGFPGVSATITEGTVTGALQAAGIKVIAISTPTGFFGAGLDDNPQLDAFNYAAAGCAPGGSAGQASRIAAATGGVFFQNVPANQVSDAILAGLAAIPSTVTPSASCPAGIAVAFNPASVTVDSGATASFAETVSVAPDAIKGTYTCTVDFLVNGASGGDAFRQTITVVVPNRPPVAADDVAQTLKNTPVTVPVLANDSDPDGDALTVTNLAAAGNGTIVVNPDGTVTYTPNAGYSGPDASTYTANDGELDSNVANILLEVINQAPVCTAATPSIATIWPPNHQMVAVDVLGVTDPDGDAVSIVVIGISQDEPTNGVGDGDTGPDGAGLGTSTAQVRAERAGTKKAPGDGRVYHIFFEATDADPNNPLSCTGEVLVGVSHDQGGQSVPVDGGALFDSTV